MTNPMTDLSAVGIERLCLSLVGGHSLKHFYPDSLHRALNEIIRRRSEEAWRPIADAPRDGTVVLVCHPPLSETEGWQYALAFWGVHNDGWISVGAISRGGTFTHFRPLPSPPVSND